MEGEINMFTKKEKMRIKIEGMNCPHCAKKVEDALNHVNCIQKAKVNLKEKIAVITFHGAVEEKIIKEQIEKLDYKVLEMERL